MAPIGSIFYRGFFYLPTVQSAARVRHFKRSSSICLTYYETYDIAIIIQGKGEILSSQDPTFQPLLEFSGINLQAWGKGNEGVFVKVYPDQLYTYVRYPDQF